MNYEQRVMRYQQSSVRDVLQHVGFWKLAYALYQRCEMTLLTITVSVVLITAVLNKIG